MGVDAQMYFTTCIPMTDQEINELAYDMADAVGVHVFWVSNGMKGIQFEGDIPRLALSRAAVYEQDGEDVYPADGETLIEVHLMGRYYGPNYERGNLWSYISTAEFIEARVQDAKVYYGGDSSGVCAEPWDREARRQLIQYWARKGHRPYYDYGNLDAREDIAAFPTCGLCTKKPLRHGWGKDYAAYSCPGCGVRKVTRDAGATWQDDRHD